MKNKTIIFTLLLIGIFSSTSACGSRRRRRHRYHPSGHSHSEYGHHSYHPSGHSHSGYGHHSISNSGYQPQPHPQPVYTPPPMRPTTTTTTTTPEPVIDVSWLQLSCKKRLCESTGNYPQREVDTAVKRVRDLLTRDSNVKIISDQVKEYFLTPNKATVGVKIDNVTGCNEFTTSSSPLGGYDIRGKPFIVVNLPNLRQVVKSSECRSKLTVCSYLDGGSVCAQAHRYQELLVLPVKRGSFYPEDFTVKSFEVQNGCKCIPIDQYSVFDILN